MTPFSRPVLMVFGLVMCILSACTPSQIAGKENARRLSGPVFMQERTLNAGAFTLTLFERIHDRGGIAHIYIEGNDPEVLTKPLPDSLISLHLASRDKARNVIYITRPCQFYAPKSVWRARDDHEDKLCPYHYAGARQRDRYKSSHRFDQTVVDSYNAALDEIRRRWGVRAFHVYGHSGGGVIATLLAADRGDILSLTTVSAMLDTDVYMGIKKLTEPNMPDAVSLTASINPADIAPRLASIPQHHYLGATDRAVPPAALLGFLQKIGPTNCVHYDIIQENGYTAGWVDKWDDILRDRPLCRGPVRRVL